jgi:AraC family transcriptional regulator of adaptative response / DNA-3-methyladenine glycosylase II
MMAAMDPTAHLDADAAYQVRDTMPASTGGCSWASPRPACTAGRCASAAAAPRDSALFRQCRERRVRGFRPCLRCRPELAPGSRQPIRRTRWPGPAPPDQHAVAGGSTWRAAVAGRLGVTDRHFRRVFQAVHGVSPMDWLATQRLLLAKRLLTDTELPVTRVALASGFASLRRFNAAFVERYRLAPTALRKSAGDPAGTGRDEPVAVRLAWRPPYDADAMFGFLAARPLVGVEAVAGGTWRRTLALTDARGVRHTGWLGLR